MKSVEDQKKLARIASAIAVGPITFLMISRQPDKHPLITYPNIINFTIGVIAAAFCGVAIFKLTQLFSKKGRPDALQIGAGLGSMLGISLYFLLAELVKQFQQ